MIISYLRHNRNLLIKSGLWCLLFVVCILLIRNLLLTAYLEFDLDVSHTDDFAVYWADEEQGYSEDRVGRLQFTPHRKQYILPLGNVNDISTLRIDPTTSTTSIRISRIQIHQFGYETFHLTSKNALQQFVPRNQIAGIHKAGTAVDIQSSGSDPQLIWNIKDLLKKQKDSIFIETIIRAFCLFTLLLIVFKWTRELDNNYGIIPYAMLVAFILILSMSSVSRINAHPDEYVHVLAARHYIDNHTPVQACKAGTEQSYSPYGFSRLNATEIAYFLNGKFTSLVAFMPTKDIFKVRLFNISLFAILLILSIRSVPFRILCIPLLAMPQTWYLFSYVNSDAFALFISLILTQQLIDSNSSLRNLIASKKKQSRIAGSLGIGFLFAFCLLIKKNFYALDIFLVGWCTLQYFYSQRSIIADLKKLVPAIFIASVFYSGWIFVHEQANDFQRTQRITECQQTKVHYRYRKDTPPHDQYHSLYWRDKGYAFTDLFRNHWGTKIFQSTFAHFGYLDILGADYYYSLLAIIATLLLLYICIEVLRHGTLDQKLTLFMAVGIGMLLISITAWKSWTKDFQPQGRYLFPLIPVLGLLLMQCRELLKPRIISSLILIMFIAGVFFFVQVGLVEIRRG